MNSGDNSAFDIPGWHSRGYLPHFDGGEIAQSITFRLADALPKKVLERWEQELSRLPAGESKMTLRRRIEKYLDQGYGSSVLKEPQVADIAQRALLHFDGKRYRLLAWVIMPNHIHFLIVRFEDYTLAQIIHSFKSYTSHEINNLLSRSGQLWQQDYFDRFIRNEKHFADAVAYIEANPVKAKLCASIYDWPYSSAGLRRK